MPFSRTELLEIRATVRLDVSMKLLGWAWQSTVISFRLKQLRHSCLAFGTFWDNAAHQSGFGLVAYSSGFGLAAYSSWAPDYFPFAILKLVLSSPVEVLQHL